MHCINKNLKEYKDLLSATGLHPMQLDVAIVLYQEENDTYDLPTAEEALSYALVSNPAASESIETSIVLPNTQAEIDALPDVNELIDLPEHEQPMVIKAHHVNRTKERLEQRAKDREENRSRINNIKTIKRNEMAQERLFPSSDYIQFLDYFGFKIHIVNKVDGFPVDEYGYPLKPNILGKHTVDGIKRIIYVDITGLGSSASIFNNIMSVLVANIFYNMSPIPQAASSIDFFRDMINSEDGFDPKTENSIYEVIKKIYPNSNYFIQNLYDNEVHLLTISEINKFNDYIEKGIYKTTTKYMSKTLDKYIYSNSLDKPYFFNLIDSYLSNLSPVNNQYANRSDIMIPGMDVIVNKFKKYPIPLNQRINLPGLKKEDLFIFEMVRRAIKEENPAMKSISAAEFIQEVKAFLNVHYALSFESSEGYKSYRVNESFDDPKTVHHKYRIIVDKFQGSSRHFMIGSQIFGSLTPFVNSKGERSVFMHEIQNDAYKTYIRNLLKKLYDVDILNTDADDLSEKIKLIGIDYEFEDNFFEQILNKNILLDIILSSFKEYSQEKWKSLDTSDIDVENDYLKFISFDTKLLMKIQEIRSEASFNRFHIEEYNAKLNTYKYFQEQFNTPDSIKYENGLFSINSDILYLRDNLNSKDEDVYSALYNKLIDYIYHINMSGKPYSLKQVNSFVKSFIRQKIKEVNSSIQKKKTSLAIKNNVFQLLNRIESSDTKTKLKIIKNGLDHLRNIKNQVVDSINDRAIDFQANTLNAWKEPVSKVQLSYIYQSNYFTSIIHTLIQEHIRQYGKDTPLYFASYSSTLNTQGVETTADLYVGPEEISIELSDQKKRDIVRSHVLDSAREHNVTYTDVQLEMVIDQIMNDRQSSEQLFSAPNSVKNKKIGSLHSMMSKIKGIKLEYIERVDGLKGASAYRVDLTNYNYDAVPLYNRQLPKPGIDPSFAEDLMNNNLFDSTSLLKHLAPHSPLAKLLGLIMNKIGLNVNIVYVENANDPNLKLYLGEDYVADEYFRGAYNSSTNTIVLNKTGLDSSTILHEVLHPLLMSALNTNQEFRNEFTKIYNEVVAMFEKKFAAPLSELLKDPDFYALTNIDEFLTGIMTNKEFADKLNQTKKEGRSFLRRIADSIANFFKGMFKTEVNKTMVESLQDKIMDALNSLNNADLSPGKVLESKVPPVLERNTANLRNLAAQDNTKVLFDEASHTYLSRANRLMNSVSEIMKKFGFSDPNAYKSIDPKTGQELEPIASEAGTVMHLVAEEELPSIMGMPAAPRRNNNITRVKCNDDAREAFKRILKEAFPPGTELIGLENMTFNEEANIAGTIDIEVKFPDGTIAIVDIKTKVIEAPYKPKIGTMNPKTGNPVRNPWYYFNRSMRMKSMPDRIKWNFQTAMYAMLRKLSGRAVDKRFMLPLELYLRYDPTANSKVYEIYDVKLPTDLTLQDDANGKGLYEFSDTNDRVNSSVEKALLVETSKAEAASRAAVTAMYNLADKAVTAIKLRAQRVKSSVAGRALLEEANKLDYIDSDAARIVGVIQLAYDELKRIMIEYEERLADEKAGKSDAWDLATLTKWHDFADSVAVLNEIQAYIMNHRTEFVGIPGIMFDDIIALVDEAISWRNMLDTAYDEKGRRILIDTVVPYSTFTIAQKRMDFERDERKKFLIMHKDLDKKRRNKLWEESGKRIAEENVEADLASYIAAGKLEDDNEAFLQELSTRSTDEINLAQRFFSSVFDNPNAIIGSVLKIYYEQEYKTRNKFRDWHKGLVDLQREFNKKFNAKSITDNRKLYDYMIDVDEGQAKLVSKFSAHFWNEYNKRKTRINEQEGLTQEEKWGLIQKMIDSMAPISDKAKEDLQIAFISRIDEWKRQGKMTQAEFDTLARLMNQGQNFSILELYRTGELTDTAADMANRLRNELIWKAREPIQKYRSAKYEAIMAMGKDDIRYRMWEYLSQTQQEGDKMGNPSKALKGRLPGVTKSFLENVVGKGFKGAMSAEIDKFVNLKPDDTQFGAIEQNEVSDKNATTRMGTESNKEIPLIPQHYTGFVPESEQSFDLPTIFAMWFKSTISFANMNEIQDLMNYTLYNLKSREVFSKDSLGRRVYNRLSAAFNKDNADHAISEQELVKKGSFTADQFESWLMQVFYGQKEQLNPILAKTLNVLNKFNSFYTMASNIYSLFNNAAIGEINNLTEVYARTFMTPATYAKASLEYAGSYPEIIGDVGSDKITSKINLLGEEFMLFDSYRDSKMRDRSRFKRLAYSSIFHWNMRVGEHKLRHSFLMGALMSIEAKDEFGNVLGSVWDMYKADGKGNLTLDPRVANFGDKERMALSRKLDRVIRSMHGNYAWHSANAIQANGAMNQVQVFRKWVAPGVERRFIKNFYNEFAEEFTVGYIRQGVKYTKDVLNYRRCKLFHKKWADESKAIELYLKANWNNMPDYERQACIRFYADMILYIGLSLILFTIGIMWPDDDDDDDKKDISTLLFGHLIYQLNRILQDQAFFFNPNDFISILRSPFPLLSTINRINKLFFQLFTPWEEYESGIYSGENKLWIQFQKNLPLLRQGIKFFQPEEQLKGLRTF